MTIIPTAKWRIELYASSHYPTKRTELRGMTIAGLRVAQNDSELTQKSMNRELITFLLSRKAIEYWIEKRWMEVHGSDVSLTEDGILTCRNSLIGEASTNTTEAIVNTWVHRMLHGDELAIEQRVFDGECFE